MKFITATELRSKTKVEKLVRNLKRGEETDLLYYKRTIGVFKPKSPTF